MTEIAHHFVTFRSSGSHSIQHDVQGSSVSSKSWKMQTMAPKHQPHVLRKKQKTTPPTTQTSPSSSSLTSPSAAKEYLQRKEFRLLGSRFTSCKFFSKCFKMLFGETWFHRGGPSTFHFRRIIFFGVNVCISRTPLFSRVDSELSIHVADKNECQGIFGCTPLPKYPMGNHYIRPIYSGNGC